MGISHTFEIIFGVKMGKIFRGIVDFDSVRWDFGVSKDTWYSGTLFG